MKNAIIMGFILHLWVGVAHGQTDAVSFMKQAATAWKSGDAAKAKKLYRKILSIDPGMKQAYSTLSIILLKQQEFGQAATLLKEATGRFPGYAEGWYNYAYSLRKIGRLKEALVAYRRFVDLQPEQADPHYGIGLTLKEMKLFGEAAVSFRRYAQLENRADKKEWVKKALALAVKMEGQARSRRAKGPAAPAAATGASTPGAANPRAATASAVTPASAKSPSAAPPAAKPPVAATPSAATPSVAKPPVAKAPAAVQPAAKLHAAVVPPASAKSTTSESPPAHVDLGQIKAPSEEGPAVSTPERRRAKKHKIRADELVRAGKAVQALAHYQRALVEDYSYTAAYNEFGTALFRLRRYSQAIKIFRVALRDNPDYHLGWYNLAYALRKEGKLPEAIVSYRKYISLNPSDPDPFFGLGLAYKDSGKQREAIAAFSDYIRHERREQQARWVQKARAEITKLNGQPPPAAIAAALPVPAGAVKAGPESKAQQARDARTAAAEKRRLAREAKAAAAAERKAAVAARKAAAAEKRRLVREARAAAAAERKAAAAARKAAAAEKRRLASEARAARKAGKATTDQKAGKATGDQRVEVAAMPAPGSLSTVQPLADVIEGPPGPEAPGQLPESVTGKWRVQADTLARRGTCDQALPLYRKVLAQDPFSVKALDGLAHCAFQLKKYAQGARSVGMGLRDNPDYSRGWLHLGRLARGEGRQQRAVGLYRRYLREVPGDQTAVFELARTLRGLGMRQQAAAEYRRYLTMDRREGEDARRAAAHQELMGVEGGTVALGAKTSAAETLLRTMGGSATSKKSVAPAVKPPEQKLSPAQQRAEKRRLAREARAAAVAERKARAAAARAARAEKRRLAREARAAAAAERKAKAAAAQAARAEKRRLTREARAAAAAERKARAAAARAARAEKRRLARLGKGRAQNAPKVDPGPTLAASIDQDLGAVSPPEIASLPAHDLLRPAPEAAQELMAVADKQFAKKRYDVAMGIYQQAVRLDPAATEPLYKAGVAAVALGRMHLAADLFAQVMQLDPKNGTALVNLKMARAAARETPPDAAYLAEATAQVRQQIESGRYAAAEHKLDQLIVDQVSAQLHMLRAEARLALGKTEEAIQDGGRALALNPGLQDVFRIMGYAHQQLNHPQRAIYYLRLYMDRGGDDPATRAKREQVKQTLSELGHL